MMATTDPEVGATIVANGRITELSKRVDATHDLVLNLDQRFESHRVRTDDKLDRVLDVVGSIRTGQAQREGADAAREEAESRKGRRIQVAANKLSLASLFVTLAAVCATVMSVFALVAHP